VCRSRRLPNGTEMRPNAPPRSQAEHRATQRGWLSLLVGKALGFAGRGGALDLDTSHVRKQMYYFRVLANFGRWLRPTRSMSTLIQI